MRWPWQRPERPVTDAPAPMRPAGWAFLPPLQRHVADAPPATLRPAFVSTLPTRSLPASLGSMGHLVDDTAPSGTVAVDDRTLGLPVQRAVATDLTLLPRPAPAAPATRPIPQRVDDSAALDSAALAPESETIPDAAAPALAVEPPDSVPTLAEELPPAANPSPPGPTASKHTAATTPAPPAATSPSAGGPSTPSTGDAASAPLVRPTLQRSAVDSAPSAGAPSPPASPAASPTSARRPGLGAPLPSRPLQRTADSAGAAGGSAGQSSRAHGPALAVPTPVESTPAETTPAGSPLPPEHTDEPAAPAVQRDREEAGQAPLLGASPLDSALASAPDASPSADHAPASGRAESSHTPSGQASAAPEPALPFAVQRTVEGADDPSAHVVDAYTHAEPESPADTSTSYDRVAGVETTASGSDHPPSTVDLAGLSALPSPGPAQRTAPLFGVQRLTPSISAPSQVPARRVVVARALAPEPPPPTAASRAARSALVAARASSPAAASSGASAGASRSPSAPGATPGTDAAALATTGPDAGLGWTSAEASVSRLVEAPNTIGNSGAEWTGSAPGRGRAPATAAVARPDAAMPVVSREPAGQSEQAQQPAQAGPARMPLVAAAPGMDVVQRVIEATVQRAEAVAPVTEASSEPAESEASVPEPGGSAGGAQTSVAPAAPAPPGENVEQLARKLYGPLVRRIKAELLLDRERRGIRIDGI